MIPRRNPQAKVWWNSLTLDRLNQLVKHLGNLARLNSLGYDAWNAQIMLHKVSQWLHRAFLLLCRDGWDQHDCIGLRPPWTFQQESAKVQHENFFVSFVFDFLHLINWLIDWCKYFNHLARECSSNRFNHLCFSCCCEDHHRFDLCHRRPPTPSNPSRV